MSNLKITFDIREYVCNESKVPDLDVYVNHLPITLIDIIASYVGYYKYRPGFGRCRQLDMSTFYNLKVLFGSVKDTCRVFVTTMATYAHITRNISTYNKIFRTFIKDHYSDTLYMSEYRMVPDSLYPQGHKYWLGQFMLNFNFSRFVTCCSKDEADF